MKSTEFLQSAMDVQKERGEQYDKPSGERSMGATVRAFNAITGHALEESDGWMLLGLLKLVRQSQNPEKYHHDSALDFVAYASLYAEAASEQCGQLEAEDVWKESPDSATHYTHEDEDHYAAFWRKDGDKFVECWTVEPEGGLFYSKNSTGYKPGNVQNMQARPTSTAK